MAAAPLFSALSAFTALPVHAQTGTPSKGEGEVDIVAWQGYIERGDNDKNYNWVTGFESSTGCKVNVKIANTSDGWLLRNRSNLGFCLYEGNLGHQHTQNKLSDPD